METPLIEFRNVTKRFGDVTAVDGVTFEVAPGELFGFVEIAGFDPELGQVVQRDRAGGDPLPAGTYYVSIEEAGRDLGWAPKIDLEQGMELMFEWVKANRDLF